MSIIFNMLTAIMLSVAYQSVALLIVVMTSVITPSVVVLNVVVPTPLGTCFPPSILHLNEYLDQGILIEGKDQYS
jgi:hypothetical protein